MKMVRLSLLFLAAMIAAAVGCDNKSSSKTGGDDVAGEEHSEDDGHDHGDEGHSHEGPHHGTVVEWGAHEFHIELTVDHDKKEATVYILGDDVKTPIAVGTAEITLAVKDPVFQVMLKASPQEGDAEGKASRFVGTHESLSIVKDYEGVISGMIDGTPYSGNFKEEEHDH